jgi:hypothetical protein
MPILFNLNFVLQPMLAIWIMQGAFVHCCLLPYVLDIVHVKNITARDLVLLF